jgi:uncharacterized protein YdiU (UPF0061 family)
MVVPSKPTCMHAEPSPWISRAGWNWDNTYARLPDALFARIAPTPVSQPQLVVFNRTLAESLGLDADVLNQEEAAGYFTGNQLFPGSEPIAQAYAGHQFGNFTRLGDGRAVLLGEHVDPSGRRWDIQLKGPGPTPYSRRGDGRAALGPMLREYVISEAMHGLGIPTTRSLAVVATGEPVFREAPLPGAVLTRVAASHLRVGTLELFAALRDFESLRTLCRYALERHYPDRVSQPNPGLALLEGVLERQVSLVAEWMRVGFVHGVLNTDNVALSGETLDYGPCAFLDSYHPLTVFSSIDHQGRYAFGRQPGITSWNLARMAEALLPVIDPDEPTAIRLAQEILATFPDRFHAAWLAAYRGKLGLFGGEEGDLELIEELLAWMEETKADFTLTFRNLRPEIETAPTHLGTLDPERAATWEKWQARWVQRLRRQDAPLEQALERMRTRNPAIISRNHAVEAALEAATEERDLTPFQTLLNRLQDPYSDAHPMDSVSLPPAPGTPRYRTFCGT